MPDTLETLPSYKPNDVDCTITAVLVELRHTRASLKRIEEQTTKTNGRVTKLEVDSQISKARLLAIIAVVSLLAGFIQWAVSNGLHKLIPSP